MATGSRNYMLQRSYYYDSHDENGNFNGLSEDDWKKQVREEWTYDKLKANHVTLIFHDKDTRTDENGNTIKVELHVHACVNFENVMTQSNVMLLSKCSSEKNCRPINSKSQAYRYLLHVTEQAIKDRKHIYDRDCLEFSIKPGKKFDYDKIISKSEEDEKKKAVSSDLKSVLQAIANGVFGDNQSEVLGVRKDTNEQLRSLTIMERLLIDDSINSLLTDAKHRAKIEYAIRHRVETVAAKSKQTALEEHGFMTPPTPNLSLNSSTIIEEKQEEIEEKQEETEEKED